MYVGNWTKEHFSTRSRWGVLWAPLSKLHSPWRLKFLFLAFDESVLKMIYHVANIIAHDQITKNFNKKVDNRQAGSYRDTF